jgi:hypothetical protein
MRELGAGLLDLQGVAEAVQHDVGTRMGEGFGDAQPDGGPGDSLAVNHVGSPDLGWSRLAYRPSEEKIPRVADSIAVSAENYIRQIHGEVRRGWAVQHCRRTSKYDESGASLAR